MKKGNINALPLTLIFIFLFTLLYFFFPQKGPFAQSWDNIPTALLPISLLNEHNFDFNEFKEGQAILTTRYLTNSQYPQYYFFINQNNKVVANYPIFSSLFIIPFYFFYSLMNPALLKIQTFYNIDVYHINFLSSIFITLINSFFIFLVIKNAVKKPLFALLAIFLFIFATPVIHTTSRFVWQHTIALLFVTLVIYSFKKKGFFLTLFFSTIVFLSRPPALLLCLPFLLSHGIKELKEFKISKISKSNWLLLFLSLLLIFFQIWYSYSYLDAKSFFAPQYSNTQPYNIGPQYTLSKRFSGNIITGFLGLILSPGRGLLFFSPLFFFSFVELIKSIKNRKNLVYGFSLLSYILLFAKNEWWYGGWTISYRYLIETIPILLLFFCIYLQKISWKKIELKSMFILMTIILSIFINTQVNTNYGDCGYNASPTDIDHLRNDEKIKRLFTDSPLFRCFSSLRKK